MSIGISQDFVKQRLLARINSTVPRPSYRTLAKQIGGLSYSTIWRFVEFDSKLDFQNLARIAKWLGLSMHKDEAIICDGTNTIEKLTEIIRADSTLSDSSKDVLIAYLDETYKVCIEFDQQKETKLKEYVNEKTIQA